MGRRDVEIAFTGKDEGAGSMIEGVGHKLKMLHKEAAASGENRIKGLIEGGFKGEDLAGLIGGGKAGLLGFFIEEGGKALGEMAEKALELKKEFYEGSINAGDMVDRLAAVVPILGTVWSAGRSIHELLFSEKEDIAAINSEAERTTKIFNAQVSAAEALRDVKAEILYSQHRAENADAPSLVKERSRIQDEIEEIQRHKDPASDQVKAGYGADSKAFSDYQEMQKALKEAQAKKTKTGLELASVDQSLGDPNSTIGKINRSLPKSYTNLYSGDPSELKHKAQQAAEEVTKIEKQVAAAKAAAIAQADQQDSTHIAEKRAQLAAQEAEWGRYRIEQARKDALEIGRVKSEAMQATMQIAGESFRAGQQAKEEQYAEEKSDIIAHEKEMIRLEADPTEQIKIQERTNELLHAKLMAFIAQTELSKKQQALAEADLEAEAHEKELRAAGKFLDAQLLQIHQSYADQIAAATSGEQRLALAKSEAADVAEAKRQGAIDEREHNRGIMENLESFRISGLEEKAMRNQANKRDLLIAQSAQRSRDKIESQQKILDDVKATAQQKSEARQNITEEQSQERLLEKRLRDGRIQEDRKGVEGLHLGNGFLGIAAMFRAGGEPGMGGKSANPAKEAADHAKQTVTEIQGLRREMAALTTALTGRGIAVRTIGL